MTNPSRFLCMGVALFAFISLAACGSTRYIGKVVPGQVGRSMIISDTDDRINNKPGIPGLQVTLFNESRSGQAPLQIARTTTDEDGDFYFSIPTKNTPKGTVVVRVVGDAIYSARSKTYLPRQKQVMLFTVVTRQPD